MRRYGIGGRFSTALQLGNGVTEATPAAERLARELDRETRLGAQESPWGSHPKPGPGLGQPGQAGRATLAIHRASMSAA